jgi:hypothetical protein
MGEDFLERSEIASCPSTSHFNTEELPKKGLKLQSIFTLEILVQISPKVSLNVPTEGYYVVLKLIFHKKKIK